MDPKLNVTETIQCQYCRVYVKSLSQQLHQAQCKSLTQLKQGINFNNDDKIQTSPNNQNQSKEANRQNTFNQLTQISSIFNNQGISINQQIKIHQVPKPAFQQSQDNQKLGIEKYQQQLNSSDLNSEGQQYINKQFTKESPNQIREINSESKSQIKFPQPPQTSSQNTIQELILLSQQQQQQQQQQNSNIFLSQKEIRFDQNQDQQQNQQQNLQQFQLFRAQDVKWNFNQQQQQNSPFITRQDNLQQKPNLFHPPSPFIKLQNQNQQQILPQLNQQQQYNFINRQIIFQPNSNPQPPIQQQNNPLFGNIQNLNDQQPIQGQPCIPLQFPIPLIQQNIQQPPNSNLSFLPKFKYNISYKDDEDDDDDDDDDEDDEYDNKGLPNFDVNKQYTDYEVNRMSQEQIYVYFSNLFINENHGYSEDQINKKINQNFTMKLDDNRIDICVICQESFTQETFTTDKQLPCSHLFHENCLIGWLKRSKQCPICKTGVEL